MERIKVKNHLNLYRDCKSNAIVNANITEYQNYIKMKTMKENEAQRIKDLENNVSEIKNDLNEIKNLLRNLANES